MSPILIFLVIYSAMIAMSFWESSVEGRNNWDKGKYGWKIKLAKYCLPAYHFWVFVVMWPLLLSLPLFIYGWDLKLFGILLSAYISGWAIEDFMWYIVNPAIKFRESFNSKFAGFYPWIKVFNKEIPAAYLVEISISLLSWYFLWR